MTSTPSLALSINPTTSHNIDLDTLTPRAAAIAEAIAEAGHRRWIRLKSIETLRVLHAGDQNLTWAHSPAELDEPVTRTYAGWLNLPDHSREALVDGLETEARKFPGWYPVADDGTDLPHSDAARDDDGLTIEQAIALLARLCPARAVPSVAAWVRNAPRGAYGYPASSTAYNGRYPLWSERDIRVFAGRLTTLVRLGDARIAAATVLEDVTEATRAAVLAARKAGTTEEEVAALAGVDRSTVRAWQGK